MPITLNLPPELESALVAASARLGTTPELYLTETVRQAFPPPPPPPTDGLTMLDFLGDYVGSVAGGGTAYCPKCGQEYADDLAAGRKARP